MPKDQRFATALQLTRAELATVPVLSKEATADFIGLTEEELVDFRSMGKLSMSAAMRLYRKELAAERGYDEEEVILTPDPPAGEEPIIAWLIEGTRHWYSAFSIIPKQVRDDTRAWRRNADRILGFWDEMLVQSRDHAIVKDELLNVFNSWLDENGHRSWSKETFHPRFSDHAETNRHRVDEKQVREPQNLSRPPHHFDQKNPVPAKLRVYDGVRFKVEEQEQKQTKDSPDPFAD
jgi:hypothetical protein